MIIPVRYRVLGPLEAGSESMAALGGPKQRLVLAVLLIRLGEAVSDDRLVDELWPDAAPDGARHAVQTYISELRRAIGDPIQRTGNGYRLDAEPAAVTPSESRRSCCRRERSKDAPASAAAIFHEALALWHGDPYGGVAESPLLRAEIHRLSELRVAVLEDRVSADLDAGRHVRVASELEALTREYPFRERLHLMRMLSLYRCDRQADALRAYHHARRWLNDELGLDPSSELQDMERRILNQDPALKPSTAANSGRATLADGAAPAAMVRGFELREQVGTGRLGSAYHAYQASVGREVVVKVFNEEIRRSPEFQGSFDGLAQRVSALDHPNALPLLDWWREAGEACVVTPWMRRGSLAADLANGPWSLTAALRLTEQVGGALAAAHRADLVHGNLTLRNVLLDADGNALVSGIGLVSGLWVAEGSAEQPSVRADVRSLAMLVIAALAGRPAETDPGALTMGQQRRDLPADLVAVLAQACSPVSSDRHERIDDLVRDIRRASGADVVAPAQEHDRPERVRNPYKGLQAFHETDAPDFFGRTAVVERLIAAIGAHRLVVVAGPSGSGKSSLVRAGLLPVLRARELPGNQVHVAEMFPGSFPFEELERALLRTGIERPDNLYSDLIAGERGLMSAAERLLPPQTELVLLVDQLEETWSLAEDVDARRLFLASLVAAASEETSRLRIVATLRADFLDRAMETHALAELTRQGLVLVTPPSPEDLTAAVAMPALQVGLRFDAGVVERVVRDVGDAPGALPLLQHAMSELVAARDGHRLTAGAYEAIGGVTGALGRRAESVYRELSVEAQGVARQLFLRLVAVDEQRDDARRRVRRNELVMLATSAALIDEVLRRFGAHRLLTFDRDPVTRGPTVEVAHEALFTEWERLHAWIDERRDDLLLHRRLRAAAQEWLAAGRSPDYLLSGGRLDEAEAWSVSTDLARSPEEIAFLDASRHHEDRASAARSRRRRLALAAAAAVAAVSLGLAVLAWFQTGRAEVGEREARARALAAASLTQLDHDQDLALVLALDAIDVSTGAGDQPLREAVDALHEVTIAHRTVSVVDGDLFVGFAGQDTGVSIGPLNGRAGLWDAESGQSVDRLEVPDAAFGDAAVSPSGHLAVSAFANEGLWVWDLDARDVIARLGDPMERNGRPAISGDDRLLAAFVDGAPYAVQVFAIGSQERLAEFGVEGWRRMAFGGGGRWLAVTDDDVPVARLHHPMDGRVIATVGDPQADGHLLDMAVDPGGERIALFIEGPNRIELYEAADQSLIRSVPVAARPGRLCFLAGGARIVAQGSDELLHVWNIDTGVEVATLPGTGFIEGLACSQHGARVAVVRETSDTIVYDLDATATTELSAVPMVDPTGGAWLPDGTMLVADGRGLHHLDASGRSLGSFVQTIEAQPGWLPVSADGRLAAIAMEKGDDPDAPIVILEVATMRQVQTVEGRDRVPLALSPDGRHLVTGGFAGASVFELETGDRMTELLLPDGTPAFAASATYLPDGMHIALKGPGSREAFVFAADDGDYVGTICAREHGLHVGVDPGGGRLVIADHRDFIEHWNLEGLLAAIDGSDSTCAEAGPNASDAFQLRIDAAPSEGGFAFSADGRWLASTSGLDGTVAVSDVVTGRRAFEIRHRGEIAVVGFSPDGRWLAITFNDTRGAQDSVRLYAVDTHDLVSLARAKVRRQLTDADCDAFPDLLNC